MDPWYDPRSQSKQYRQEALREVRERDLFERARASNSLRSGRARTNGVRKHALSSLHTAHLTQ